MKDEKLPFMVREQSIRRMERILGVIVENTARQGCDSGKSRRAVSEALLAECLRCHTQLSGAELLLVGEFSDPPYASPRVRRLRSGRCAEKTCDYESYRLIFLRHPEVDWQQLLAHTPEPPQSSAEEASENVAPIADAPAQPRRRLTLTRLTLLFGFAVLVLIYRHYYVGGKIPF